MAATFESPSEYELPRIEHAVIKRVRDDIAQQPSFYRKALKRVNNIDHELAQGIRLEADVESEGDLELKIAFENGALFAYQALKSQIEVAKLEMLFGLGAAASEDTVPIDGELGNQAA